MTDAGAQRVVQVSRVLFALEFGVALGAWALGACLWPVAGIVATVALTAFMLTWGDRSEASAPASVRAPKNPRRCALGCGSAACDGYRCDWRWR